MTAPHRKAVLKALIKLRETRLRRPILKVLVGMHNFGYRWITFFASYKGVHPKHEIQKYHQFFAKYVRQDDEVLDLGCGDGAVAYQMALKAKKVLGIDSRPESIARAKSRYQKPNLEYQLGDITKLPAGLRGTVIIMSNVLEHIEDRVGLLRELKGKAAKILIRAPLITRDWISVYKKSEGFEYRLDETHQVEYSEDLFKEEAQAAGLRVVSFSVSFGELYAVCEPVPSENVMA